MVLPKLLDYGPQVNFNWYWGSLRLFSMTCTDSHNVTTQMTVMPLSGTFLCYLYSIPLYSSLEEALHLTYSVAGLRCDIWLEWLCAAPLNFIHCFLHLDNLLLLHILPTNTAWGIKSHLHKPDLPSPVHSSSVSSESLKVSLILSHWGLSRHTFHLPRQHTYLTLQYFLMKSLSFPTSLLGFCDRKRVCIILFYTFSK